MLVKKGGGNPYRQYRNNQIYTSTPAELVMALFDGALRFVRQAAAALECGELDEAHRFLDRAQEILTELTVALDFKQEEIAQNLFSLYEYINSLLVKANVGRDAGPLEGAAKILLSLREAWAGASRICKGSGAEKCPPGVEG